MKRMMVLVTITLLAASCGSAVSTSSDSGSSSGNGSPARFGVQSKTSDCVASNGLEDSACTPGAIFSDVTTDQICTPGYSKSVRDVSTAEKDQVYAEYNIA